MLPADVAEQLFAGRVISGRFRLDRELGRGGMGTVWEARHIALETQVAIKFLKSELSQRQDIRARFAREATSAARIRSPHIVGILDSGFTDDDFAFIVMELLRGEDLGRQLARRGCYSLDEARSLVLQVARGLDRAHSVGILHRDLKPENLFITDDQGPNIKILDFGIAKAFGPEATTHKTDTGQLLGTPMYMSPEQALGRALDARSDLYSLAVVAYRCLAGRAPFDHAAPGEMIVAVSMHTPPPPSSFNPALPPEIDAWFAGALCKDPDARSNQTALALGESFERACVAALSAPVQPGRTSRPPRSLVSGATLADDEVAVPSAEEVATTVLVPQLAMATGAKRRPHRAVWLGAAAFLGAAAGGAALVWSPLPPAKQALSQASAAPREPVPASVEPRPNVQLAVQNAFGLGEPPPAATPAVPAAGRPTAAPSRRPPSPPPRQPGADSAAESRPAESPVAAVEPQPTSVSEPPPVPPSVPPPAQAQPGAPGPGIDRTSPWE